MWDVHCKHATKSRRILCAAFGSAAALAAVLSASWQQQNVFKQGWLASPESVAVSSALDLAVVLESKPEVVLQSKPAAPLDISELALPAWDPNFRVRIFFFLFLWKVTPDTTVISKIGFVEFFKVFNFCKSLNQMAAYCAACLPCEMWQELVGFTSVCR